MIEFWDCHWLNRESSMEYPGLGTEHRARHRYRGHISLEKARRVVFSHYLLLTEYLWLTQLDRHQIG